MTMDNGMDVSPSWLQLKEENDYYRRVIQNLNTELYELRDRYRILAETGLSTESWIENAYACLVQCGYGYSESLLQMATHLLKIQLVEEKHIDMPHKVVRERILGEFNVKQK